MSDICKVCGLPADICMCESLAREGQQILVGLEKKRFGKVMTIIDGLQKSNLDLNKIGTDLKRKLACGGTISNNKEILLQGDHLRSIRKALIKLGFKSESIKIQQ